jgi:DDE superfamily endonuclease
LGYSKKGYTDGEIGQAWIEHFDKQTRAKARGRRRLLLVDGHNSHYTRGFLEYARTHQIEVVAYPSHSTHVYQGLDVAIFATMKQNWSDARDHWERSGKTVDKTNFLAIYAEAHLKTLSPENIKSAFRKTGVIPLNPDVITEPMMAPSLETSIRGTLPIEQSSPVKTMAAMIRDYLDYQKLQASASIDALADGQTHDLQGQTATPFFVRAAVDELASTSASFLTATSTLQSTSAPPAFKPATISPIRRTRYSHLLDNIPQTAQEQDLQNALRESEARDEARKESMLAMQAGVVLAGMYVDRAQEQLQAVEEKKKKNGKKRLMGDGKAKLFTGDEFYNLCVADEQERKKDAAVKEQRHIQRETHTVTLVEWKKVNDAIRERNEAKRAVFNEALKAWEDDRDAAKREKRRPGWTKPRWKDYSPEILIQRPKRVEAGDEDEESSSSDDDSE